MLIWVIYDIGDDKSRSKISKKCKDIGLYRVQKSVFLGQLNKSETTEIKSYIECHIDKDKDSVYIFPIQKKDYQYMGILGQAFDKELVSNEIIQTFI